jgi:CubicO group peptidase (beta-lactamase class C family)
VQGTCEPAFARVREEFERNFAERGESGASVCVYVDGARVVDLWGGVTDETTRAPWQQDTMNVIFSCTKGLTSLAGHMCVDRGLLDFDQPAARYWPEFGQAGKQEIPVRMLFNHQAGLPAFREMLPRGGMNDWDRLVGILERSTPYWTPGTRTGYHGMTMGVLVGELVRRVTGRTVGTFLREEVAEPLGLDCWIGLPAEHEHRVARSMPAMVAPTEGSRPTRTPDPERLAFRAASRLVGRSPRLQRQLRRSLEARPEMSQASPLLLQRMASLEPLWYAFMNIGDWLELSDTREAHAAEIPAGGGIGNARGLAGAYAPLSLDGAHDGVRLVSPGAIARMRYTQSAPDVDALAGIRTSYTMGFSKSWSNPGVPNASVIIGEDAFGTPGMGGQIGFADPAHRLAFAYTMTKHGPGGALNDRGQSLVDSVYAILGSPTRSPGFWMRPTEAHTTQEAGEP